ncbi:ABC transporter permease [Streptomyces sp. NPDC041068]|uniref:ABC transporter permease n=1 Tax=Streptomyces sp. NPDC041068 TaxID=3155130 RepID=UPI0033EC30C6
MRLIRRARAHRTRTHLGPRDLSAEALAGVVQRPGRSTLTALGTVLGVGTLVTVLGLTATASSQIDARFNRLTATEVTVKDTGGTDSDTVANAFPADADSRIERLNGSRHAGVYWTVGLGRNNLVGASPDPGAERERATTVAASPGVLRAAGAQMRHGRVLDRFHERRHERVAVIGSALASRLGITTLRGNPAVFIDDAPFTVIGIVEDVDRKPDLLMSVVVPRSTAEAIWGEPEPGERARMLISTRLGAAQQLATQAATALDPAHPERFTAVPPPDPRTLRTTVTGDLEQLFLLLAGVCLVIGAVGIANTTLVAVMERTGEIGLRRALGARRHHITLQFLTESGFLGALGGVAGTAAGTVAVVAVAYVREWTPVIHPAVLVAAPVTGLVTGLLAGLYPAWRASRVPPAEALRR